MYANLFDYIRLSNEVGDSIQLDQIQVKQFDGYRKIFRKQIFDSQEINLISEMQSSLSRMRIEYSKQTTPDDILLRYLQANKFNSDRAVQQFVRGLQWFRENPNVFDLTQEIEDIFVNINSKNFIKYLESRDLNYKPTMVVNPWKIDKYKQSLSLITKGLEILMAIMEEYMFYPGKVESWVVIIDTQQMSLFDIQFQEILNLFQLLQDHFPCTLERLYIIDPSLSLNLAWSEIEKNLTSQVKEKIFFLDSDDIKDLSSNYDPDQLDRRFGGNLENYPYWPPENRKYEQFKLSQIQPQIPEVQQSLHQQFDTCQVQNQQVYYVLVPGQYQLPLNMDQCDCSEIPQVFHTQTLNGDYTSYKDDDIQSYHRRFVSYNPIVDHPLLNKTYGDLDINDEPQRSQINIPRPSITNQAEKQLTHQQERKSDLSFLYKHDGHCPECIKRAKLLKELNDDQQIMTESIVKQPFFNSNLLQEQNINYKQPRLEEYQNYANQSISLQQQIQNNNYQAQQSNPFQSQNQGNQSFQNFNNQIHQQNYQQSQNQYKQPAYNMVPQTQPQQQMMQFQQSTFSNPFFMQDEQDLVSYPEQNQIREIMFPNSIKRLNSQIDQQQMSFNQDQNKINQLLSSQQFLPRMTDEEYQYHNYEELDREIQKTGNKYNF